MWWPFSRSPGSLTPNEIFNHAYDAGRGHYVLWMTTRMHAIADEMREAGDPAGGSALLKIACRLLDEYRAPACRPMHPEDIGLTSEGKLP